MNTRDVTRDPPQARLGARAYFLTTTTTNRTCFFISLQDMKLHEIDVTVSVGDQTLGEYAMQNEEGSTVTCWIPSEEGKASSHHSERPTLGV